MYLVLVTGSHMVVDRWKVKATRRAEAVAQEQARARIERTGQVPASGLGSAWTPWPGILFLADQVLHLTFAIVGWLVILAGASLLPAFVDFVNALFRNWDRAIVHAVILTTLVIVSLLIVNTRAAFYFVLALVSPRELAPGAGRRGPPPRRRRPRRPGTPSASGPSWRPSRPRRSSPGSTATGPMARPIRSGAAATRLDAPPPPRVPHRRSRCRAGRRRGSGRRSARSSGC